MTETKEKQRIFVKIFFVLLKNMTDTKEKQILWQKNDKKFIFVLL